MTSAISIKKLRFSYGAQDVLKLDSLSLARGESTLIFGDSGCGKSTLMNLISGILSGYKGELQVLGENMANLSPGKKDNFRAKNIAVIFQQFNLIPYLTARENALLGLTLTGRNASAERTQEILNHLQISEIADEKAVNLSHGQQQRVAAARAFLLEAPIILADEPTSALDDTNSRLFLDLLFREAKERKTTVIVVSHDLRFKKRFSRQIDLAKLNKHT